MTKWICKKCKKEAEEKYFATFKDKNGNTRRRGVCKDCRHEYAVNNFESLKEWRKNYNVKNKERRNRRYSENKRIIKEKIGLLKSITPCADCGKNFPSVAMDFDHVFEKTKSIGTMISGGYTIHSILEEIKKCEIVCACCHRVRTDSRKQNHTPFWFRTKPNDYSEIISKELLGGQQLELKL